MRYKLNDGAIAAKSSQVKWRDLYPYLVPPQDVTVQDLMATHANATDMTATMPPIPAIGAPPWETAIGSGYVYSYTASGGEKYAAPLGTVRSGVRLSLGSTDHQVGGLFDSGAAGDVFGLMLRVQDGSNYAAAFFQRSTNTVRLHVTVAGSATPVLVLPFEVNDNKRLALAASVKGSIWSLGAWELGSDIAPVQGSNTNGSLSSATKGGIYFLTVTHSDANARLLEFYGGTN